MSERTLSEQPFGNFRNPWSLLGLSSWAIVTSPGLIEFVLDLHLPSQVIVSLFASSLSAMKRNYHIGLKPSIIAMLSRWPREELCPVDLVGEDMATSLFVGSTGQLLIEWFMEALLCTKSTSKLRKLDLSGFTIPQFFQLPLLWLPPKDRTPERFMEEIHSKYGHFLTREDQDLGAVLKWRLNQMVDTNAHGKFEGSGQIAIHFDTEVELSEWNTMCDEMLGLMICNRTPFAIKLNKLSLANYQVRNVEHFKWLLTMIDKEHLHRLVMYGYRRSIACSLHDVHEELKDLPHLVRFTWATAGPKLLKVFGREGPTDEEVLVRSADVLHTWKELKEMYFNGVTLKNSLAVLLNSLVNPLEELYLNKNDLALSDLDYLGNCHHLSTLRDLTIERTDLSYLGNYVVDLAKNSASLRYLSIKDTNLSEEHKIKVVEALQECKVLRTLCLYETESMLTEDGYQVIVHLACNIPCLKYLFIFPFNHEPFEKHFRQQVVMACTQILTDHKRSDLQLAY